MRRRLALGFLLAPTLFTTAFLTLACSGGAEKPVLDNFFRAARMRDNVTMSNIATVSFDARTQGQVESFSVTNVGEEKVEPLQLKALAKAFDEAKKADDEFTKNKLAFQDEHPEELKALLAAEKAGQAVKAKGAAEFKTSWDKWREDTKTSSKKVSEAREKLAVARSIADVSVMNPQSPVDPTQYDGEMATKDYTISAKIITPDGQHVTKPLVITMHQARLKGDKPITGKWIITGIKEAGGGTTN